MTGELAPIAADGSIPLWTAPGDDWDAKVDSAIAAQLAARDRDPITRPIVLPTADIRTGRSRVMPPGLVLDYPYGHAGFQRGAQTTRCSWTYTGGGSMWKLGEGQDFDWSVTGIAFQATQAGATLFDSNGKVGWTGRLRDVAASGWTHVVFGPQGKFLNTLITVEGFCNWNNARGTQAAFGGSDARIACSRWAMDVGGNGQFQKEFAESNAFLVEFLSQQKTPVQGIYATAQGKANGLRVRNSDTDGPMNLTDSVIEGRNAKQPCERRIVSVERGIAQFDRVQLNYVKRPGNQDGSMPDRGAGVVVEGGARAFFHQVSHTRADGVSEDVPVMLVKSGAEVDIRQAVAVGTVGDGKANTSWRDRRIRVFAEDGAKVTADDSVVVLRSA